VENLEYYASGRLKYNEEFHFAYKEKWTEEDNAYLCYFHSTISKKRNGAKMRDVAFALGRTESTCLERVRICELPPTYASLRSGGFLVNMPTGTSLAKL